VVEDSPGYTVMLRLVQVIAADWTTSLLADTTIVLLRFDASLRHHDRPRPRVVEGHACRSLTHRRVLRASDLQQSVICSWPRTRPFRNLGAPRVTDPKCMTAR
jgi:hypothetical protein